MLHTGMRQYLSMHPADPLMSHVLGDCGGLVLSACVISQGL